MTLSSSIVRLEASRRANFEIRDPCIATDYSSKFALLKITQNILISIQIRAFDSNLYNVGNRKHLHGKLQFFFK